jgi:hypothetical protein
MNDGGRLLIPDLQREYVWNHINIIYLMDTLFRGWPFGTLLLWEVEEDGPVRIPARSFWKVVDKTAQQNSIGAAKCSDLRKDENWHMVLDGQQRLQSLFIAVGNHEAGIIDYDYEWDRVHYGKRRDSRSAARKKVCPRAGLYLDLELFQQRYEESAGNVTSIDYTDGILKWVLDDLETGEPFRPGYRWFPLGSKKENSGNILRLSLLWEFAAKFGPNYDFEKLLSRRDPDADQGTLLDNWLKGWYVGEEQVARYRTAVAKLLLNIRSLRESDTAYLELLPASTVGIDDEVEYNNMVVSIFTRMNNAGIQLTRQEITFAWLKRGWDPRRTNNKDAAKCFGELRNKARNDYGVTFSLDELITGTGLACSMLRRNGEVIRSKDLMNGPFIHQYAEWFCREWTTISAGVESVLGILKERKLLYHQHYHSLYSVGLLWAWRTLAEVWKNQAPSVAQKTDALMKIEEALADSSDRWLLCSSWAGVWSGNSAQTTQNYLKKLSEQKVALQSNSWNQSGDEIMNCLHSWRNDIEAKAQVHINELVAGHRTEVVSYRPLLWVWHRLDSDRWTFSKDLMRDPHNRNDGRLDVDHCVSVDVWMGMLAKDGFVEGTPEHVAKLGKINLLGNCTLLHKSLNCSKNAASMDTFLSRISTINKQGWQDAMGINDALIHPENYTSDEVVAAIESRDVEMRKNLCSFVTGRVKRQDLQPHELAQLEGEGE